MAQIFTDANYPLQKETFEVIGICMEAHKKLGHGFLEIVYKDAIELELRWRNIHYLREQEYKVEYKGTILPHKFFADFVISNAIILEAKACEGGLASDHIAMTINYLKVSGCKIGLLVNFGRQRLEYKRLIF